MPYKFKNLVLKSKIDHDFLFIFFNSKPKEVSADFDMKVENEDESSFGTKLNR